MRDCSSHVRTAENFEKVETFLPNLVVRSRQLVENLATVKQFQVDRARGMLGNSLGAVSSSIRRRMGLTAISWRNCRGTMRAWCGWCMGLN